MVEVIIGDLFDTKYANTRRVIAHGCNSQGVMGSGVALSIKKLYPYAFSDYVDAHKTRPLKLGQVVYSVMGNNLVIANCVTQVYYGRDKGVVYVNYDAVQLALNDVANYAKLMLDAEVHLPLIGGGLANGNKEELMGIYETSFKDVNAKLFILPSA